MLETNEIMNSKLCDKKSHKICEVCGDKERGRNFGVITCESCKAFFRRFGLRNKLINICPSNGNCIINPLTRRICQRCRLDKCFAVGMRKEFIRTDEQNEERKEIIRENKLKREKCNYLSETSVSSVYSFTDSLNDLIIFDENKEKDILDEILDNTIDFTLDEITDIENNITDTIIDETFVVLMDINEKCKNRAIVPMFREMTNYNGLNELENNRIWELTSAAVLFEHKMSDNIIQVNYLEELSQILSRKQEYLIVNMVNFTKSLSGFTKMCPDDRVALLKYGYSEMLYLRNLKYFNKITDNFSFAIDDDNTIMVNLGTFGFGNHQYIDLVRPLMHQLVDEWNYDDTIAISLLTAIIFYNPNRPNIAHKQTVKLEQQLYIYLLQRYLLWKYRSDSESRVNLQKLMLSLKVLNTLNELEIKFGVPNYKNFKQYTGPLVKDIYDL